MILCIYLVYSVSFLKRFAQLLYNNLFSQKLFFLRFRNKSYFVPQKLMHTPASRQPAASYALYIVKKVLGMHAQVVTNPPWSPLTN